MKYYTKEWYNLVQHCSHHYGLKVSHSAQNFSEEYYQKLYNKKLNKYLKSEKRQSELTVDDVYGVESGKEGFKVVIKSNDMTEEECLREAEEIQKEILEARAAFVPSIYDEKESIEAFNDGHKSHIDDLKNTLPEEILKNIVDIRVFSLGIASKYVKKAVRKWCENNDKEVKRILDECGKTLTLNSNAIGEDIITNYMFHDREITSVTYTEDEFIIELDNAGGFTDIDKVIFKNYSIIEKDENLKGAIWLYEEIYPTNSGNEYHALLWGNKGKLLYLTVVASDIEFQKKEHLL